MNPCRSHKACYHCTAFRLHSCVVVIVLILLVLLRKYHYLCTDSVTFRVSDESSKIRNVKLILAFDLRTNTSFVKYVYDLPP